MKRSVPLWATALLAAIAAAIGVLFPTTPKPTAPESPPPSPASSPADVMNYDGVAFETTESVHAEGQTIRRWPTDQLRYSVDMTGTDQFRPRLPVDAIRQCYALAWEEWTARLAITATEVADESLAHVRHRHAPIDGAGKTLAWSYLPDGTNRPVEQRYDTAEAWTAGEPAPGMLSLRAVAVHEIGHALGLMHDDAQADAIMRPTYSALITKPTSRDIRRAVGIGYKERAVAGPDARSVILSGTFKATDLGDALRKLGWVVTPPK